MSTLKADTIQSTGGGAATLTKQEASKLRCRYNQATASLDSGGLNVTSISDDSTGLFTVSITSSMNDALYSISGLGGEQGNANNATFLSKYYDQADYSTSAIPVSTWDVTGNFRDSERDSVIVFGDLA